MNNEYDKRFIRKICFMGMAALSIASLSILAFTDNAEAERRRSRASSKPPAGCTIPGASMDCYPAIMSTGCVGLTNKTNNQIGFVFAPLGGGSTSASAGTTRYTLMDPGQTRKADFTWQIHLSECIENKNGVWTYNSCANVLSVGENRNSGGGCGCSMFTCLETRNIYNSDLH